MALLALLASWLADARSRAGAVFLATAAGITLFLLIPPKFAVYSLLDNVQHRRYRKLALALHPDRDPSEAARKRFADVCLAYDVLSTPELKGVFDLFGQPGLRDGVRTRTGEVRGGGYTFDASPDPSTGGLNPKGDPARVFNSFFGTANPYQALLEMASSFEGLTTAPVPAAGRRVVRDLECTLEEIYTGVVRRVQHRRRVPDVNKGPGHFVTKTVEVTIDVAAGTPTGTRWVFDGLGDQEDDDHEAGPAVYRLAEAAHPQFSREGDDLVHVARLSLGEAIGGRHVVRLEHLDGRAVAVPVADVVGEGATKTLRGEGMPIRPRAAAPDEAARSRAADSADAASNAAAPKPTHGNLVVRFEVAFPRTLSAAQKDVMRLALLLPPPHKMTKEHSRAVHDFCRAAEANPPRGWARTPVGADTEEVEGEVDETWAADIAGAT